MAMHLQIQEKKPLTLSTEPANSNPLWITNSWVFKSKTTKCVGVKEIKIFTNTQIPHKAIKLKCWTILGLTSDNTDLPPDSLEIDDFEDRISIKLQSKIRRQQCNIHEQIHAAESCDSWVIHYDFHIDSAVQCYSYDSWLLSLKEHLSQVIAGQAAFSLEARNGLSLQIKTACSVPHYCCPSCKYSNTNETYHQD